MNDWINTLNTKIHELESIASWASIVNFPEVRDSCRIAQWTLKKEVERIKREYVN